MMKALNLMAVLVFVAIAVGGCNKSGSPTPEPDKPTGPYDPNAGVTTGNTTNYKGYIVKTIGVNMMQVGVDKNYKLTTAYLYGGGNKIVLKAGKGYNLQISNTGISTCPDDVTYKPDGMVPYIKTGIDNGKMLDTTFRTVIRLRGFDKAKTGYNQLNIVFCDFQWESYWTGGYYNNVIFTKFEKQAGKKNEYYGQNDFVASMFNGDINVASVEIAPPVSDKTYIVEDQVVFGGLATHNYANGLNGGVDMSSRVFRFLSDKNLSTTYLPIAKNLTSEWVNADNGTVTGSNGVYEVKFNNVKAGDKDAVIESTDTLNRVFLRVKGFDRKLFGFDALRLFVAEDITDNTQNKGAVRIYTYNEKGQKMTFDKAKQIYSVNGTYGYFAAPLFPHY